MNPLRSSFSRQSAQMLSWFRSAAHRRRLEAEMEAELADHLDHLTADLMRVGHSPVEARRRAHERLPAPYSQALRAAAV